MKPGGKVDVQIPQDDGDLNAMYDAELNKFAKKAPKEVRVVSEAEKHEDYYKGFRSMVVLAWIFCNGALAAVVLNAAGLQRVSVTDNSSQRATIYLGVVLWSVAGLSLFRFIGAMWFLVVRLVSFTPSPQHPQPKLTAYAVPRSVITSISFSSCGYEHVCATRSFWHFWRIGAYNKKPQYRRGRRSNVQFWMDIADGPDQSAILHSPLYFVRQFRLES
jgi:hypothetical protein